MYALMFLRFLRSRFFLLSVCPKASTSLCETSTEWNAMKSCQSMEQKSEPKISYCISNVEIYQLCCIFTVYSTSF